MKSKLTSGRVVLVPILGVIFLAACAGTSANSSEAAHLVRSNGAFATPSSGTQPAPSPELRRQVELLDRLEALVNKFDSAVTNLERAKDEWGYAQAGDLTDIGNVADGIGKQRGGVPETGLDNRLEPRLDAMVKRVQGISARYTALQPKIDRLVASLKTQGAAGEQRAP